MVVRKAGGLVAGVRFSPPRPVETSQIFGQSVGREAFPLFGVKPINQNKMWNCQSYFSLILELENTAKMAIDLLNTGFMVRY